MTRKNYWFLISFLIFLSVLFFGYFGYNSYKVFRYNKLGDEAIAVGNWNMARFWYAKTLEFDAENTDALNQLSKYSSYYRDPQALDWWGLNIKAQPFSNEVKLGYAEVLLRNKQLEEAKKHLDELIPSPEQTAKYNNLLTAYHITKNEYKKAEEFARKSLESSPNSTDLKLNLFNILLRIGNPESRDEINGLLVDLTGDEENFPSVWRVLLGYSMGRKNWKESLSIAEKLSSHEEAKWYEKTAYLQLLIRFNPEKIESFLASNTAPETRFIEETCKILNQSKNTQLAQNWLDLLIEKGVSEDLSFQLCRADGYSALSKWKELKDYLEKRDWEYFDYYRETLLSRAYFALGQSVESNQSWNSALKKVRKAGVNEEIRLATIVESWSEFQPRWLTMLDGMLLNSVHTKWAYNVLQSHYFEMKATQELYRVSQRAWKILPDDSEISNNAIMQGLLLNDNVSDFLEPAKKLFEKHPEKPIPTSTYSFALYKNGHFEEAYKLISTIEDRFFGIAELAHYAAVISIGAGHENEGAAFIEKAQKASLLPEEKALLLL